MKEVEHTNGLVSHKPDNPYEGKIFFIRTISPTGIDMDKEIEINNQIEFSAALEEIAQFNSNKDNVKMGLQQRLITL